MRRREFVVGFGATAAWPIVAVAQQRPVPVIGFLSGGDSDLTNQTVARPFAQGLRDTGYVEGQNVLIERRFAEGQYGRLAELAADLVRLRVRLIVALPPSDSALAAMGATSHPNPVHGH